MNRTRIALTALAAVLLVLLGGVWLVPTLLDWNRYRDGIAAIASARVGRPVRIGGAITLHLLPQPILTAADVSVEDDGDGIGMRARALRLRVGLGALLSGTVDARELTLQGADLRLPWPPPAGALAQRPPAWISGLRAEIEDGRLQVGGLALTQIDATLATDPETGTLSAAGTGQAGPRSWQFTARLTRVARDGAAGLDFSLDGQGPLRDTGGTFSGQIGADGTLSGRVAGRGPDLSLLMPAPAAPWRADGRFTAAAGLAVADELALEIGGAPARGAVALRVVPDTRLDLSIVAGRLDLDAWLPALLKQDAPGRFAVPTGIDLSAEAASWAGGTLRRLRAAVDMAESGISLREVSAVLPGDARLDLSGQVAAAPQFTGTARLAAPDLRTTLRWARGLLPSVSAILDADLPSGVLRAATLSASLAAAPGSIELSDLRGTLDGAAITGSAGLQAGSRPALHAAITLDQLPLENWLPVPEPEPVATPAQPGAPKVSAARPGSDPVQTRLRALDADVRLQVRSAHWGALPLGAILLEAQTEASRIVLRRLEAQPLGMRLQASGQMGDNGRLIDARAELAAPDLAPLRSLLPRLMSGGAPAVPEALLPLLPLLRGPGSAVVQAAGPPDAVATRLTLEASDLRVEAQPVLNLTTRRMAGPLTVHHPGAPRLFETLGLGGTAAWLGDGSFSLVGQAALAPGRLDLTGATLAAGAARLTGRVSLEGRRLSGQLAAETLPLPMLYMNAPEPLPLDGLRDWQATLRLDAAQVLVGLTPVLQNAGADLSLEAGRLQLTKLTARAAGGTLEGELRLDAAAEPPGFAARGQAAGMQVASAVADAPIDLLAGQFDLVLDLTAAGHSPAALLATLGGTGTLRLRNGLLQGFDLPAIAAALALPTAEGLTAARAALLAGSTPITAAELKLAFERGALSLSGPLDSESGQGALAGSIDLRTGAQDLRLTLTPNAAPAPAPTPAPAPAPALGLRITGPLERPQRTPELAPLVRWFADRPPAPATPAP
ncbi:MAG: AsmA family protein [Janthinobacterium lividum]